MTKCIECECIVLFSLEVGESATVKLQCNCICHLPLRSINDKMGLAKWNGSEWVLIEENVFNDEIPERI